MSTTKRLILAEKGRQTHQKAVVIESGCSLEQLCSAAKNKLRFNVHTLALVNGTVLTSDNAILELPPGTLLICSKKELSTAQLQRHSDQAPASRDAIELPTSFPAQDLPEADTEKQKSGANELNEPPDGGDGWLLPFAPSHFETLATGARMGIVADQSLIEEDAMKQLRQTALDYPSIRLAVGMPDLHPGNGFPIGAAFAAQGEILPFLVGNDIGCGMSLFPTRFEDKGGKRAAKWADKLQELDGPWSGDTAAFLGEHGIEPTEFDEQSLGTIGGGNHFAELQAVEHVVSEEHFARLGMEASKLYLLVHSGSRGLGESILRRHVEEFKTAPLRAGSPEAERYLARHDHACRWARANRHLIARRFLEALQNDDVTDLRPLLDIWHNLVVTKHHDCWRASRPSDSTSTQGASSSNSSSGAGSSTLWLHRKGAAPTDQGPIVIPGSRGAHSYLVVPTSGEGSAAAHRAAAFSAAHGAGRRWNRGKALAMGQARYPNPRALATTALGSQVVCGDTGLLYQEQPDAYKEIEHIIRDLESWGLIHVVAIMRPVITYKTRGSPAGTHSSEASHKKEQRKHSRALTETVEG